MRLAIVMTVSQPYFLMVSMKAACHLHNLHSRSETFWKQRSPWRSVLDTFDPITCRASMSLGDGYHFRLSALTDMPQCLGFILARADGGRLGASLGTFDQGRLENIAVGPADTGCNGRRLSSSG